QQQRARTIAAFSRQSRPHQRANFAASARADISLRDWITCGSLSSLIAHPGIGAYPAVTQIKIENNRGGNDRHGVSLTSLVPLMSLVQIANDAIRGGQTKGAATCQHDGVDMLDQMQRAQQVSFARPRCASTLVNTGNRSWRAENDSTSGNGLKIRSMADTNTGNGGQCVIRLHPLLLHCRHRRK